MCKTCDAEGVLLEELERVILENTDDDHNKMYTLWIEPRNSGFCVMGRWGPIGKWQKSQAKSQICESIGEARMALHAVHDQKIKHGYVRRVCR